MADALERSFQRASGKDAQERRSSESSGGDTR